MRPAADVFIGRQVVRAGAGAFSFGHWLSHRDLEVEPHGHEAAHFILVTAGDFVSGAEGDGAALIFNPAGAWHDDHFAAGGAFFALNTPLREAKTEFALPTAPTRVGAPDALVAIARLMRACLDWDADAQRAAEALCFEALGATARRPPNERTPPRWLAAAADLLRDGEAGVAETAATVGVHPIHLARTFRAFHGSSPGQFLRAHRVRRAAAMLMTTRKTLADIAQACGFADQSHFTRSFARAHGVTPERFRRMIA